MRYFLLFPSRLAGEFVVKELHHILHQLNIDFLGVELPEPDLAEDISTCRQNYPKILQF